MAQPPYPPLHFLPPPRPVPPGATSNTEDTVLMVWCVIFAVVACGALTQALRWGDRAINSHLNQEEFLASSAATLVFLVFSALVGLRYFMKMGARKRVLSIGTATPGTVLHTTQIRRRTRGGQDLGTRYVVRVGFDSREATIFDLHRMPDPQTPVFIHGKWAGIFVPGQKPEVGLGKVRPRRP